MIDRHARWSVRNLFDARDAELRCPHGSIVQAGLNVSGLWYVIAGGKRHETEDAVPTAAFLNQYGVLPVREHEACVLEELDDLAHRGLEERS